MTKRVKKIVCTGMTRQQAETACAHFALADTEEQKLMAAMAAQIAEIREKYRPLLQNCAEIKEKTFEQMQTFATEHKDQLFDKRRSLETPYGTFGFRLATPALKPRKGFTWPLVTQLLKQFLPDFVRVKEEPAKDLLLSAVRRDPTAPFLLQFEKCGVYIEQSETFFVECKKGKPDSLECPKTDSLECLKTDSLECSKTGFAECPKMDLATCSKTDFAARKKEKASSAKCKKEKI